ncbi:MAG: bacillithiol system redox-active protein YtxJ [Ferruginibacter sp.]|nr:bacillithiol system redox-active protein YtxJ [Ferruginibacter sp.]
MNWKEFTNEEGLEAIKKRSAEKPQVIFKHSTRCSISTMAKGRLERSTQPEGIDFNYLDLIAHRNISAKIADVFDVQHESPQILIIKDGKCIYDESHNGINMDEIAEAVA